MRTESVTRTEKYIYKQWIFRLGAKDLSALASIEPQIQERKTRKYIFLYLKLKLSAYAYIMESKTHKK